MAHNLPLDELSAVFARIRGLLLTEETVNNAVELLARAAKEIIPNTLGAGVTMVDETGRKTSTAATDRVVERLDAVQYETGEGPCLNAWAAKRTIRIDDTAAEDRWPLWISAVSALPVRSTLSTPLIDRGSAIGAMKVYSSVLEAFTDETERLLEMFAGPAAALLANVQTNELPKILSTDLRNSLRSRDTISLAKGMLMERHGFEESEALTSMIDKSRRGKNTLYRVALEVIAGDASGSYGQHGF